MTKIRCERTGVLLLALWVCAFAQSVTDFKVGDWAQMNMGGTWFTVTIAG